MRNDVPYESFEVTTCDFCEGTKRDNYFGTACIECQKYSFEPALKFLNSMLAIQPEDGLILKTIEELEVTVKELKIESSKFHRTHLANASLKHGLQKPDTWVRRLILRNQKTCTQKLSTTQILEIVVDQVLNLRKQIKLNEFQRRFEKVQSLKDSSKVDVESIIKNSFGFDFEAPSFIYFIKNHGLAALKVGVSTVTAKDKRISSHHRYGWVQVKTWKVENGLAAMDIERKLIAWWRLERNAKFGCTPDQMPQGGYTETVPSADFDDSEVISKIEELIALEGVLEYRYPNFPYFQEAPTLDNSIKTWLGAGVD